MKKQAIIVALLAILLMGILSMPVIAMDNVPNPKGEQTITLSALSDNSTGPQTWNLHSKAVSGGYVMDQANNSANNGAVKLVTIAGGASTLWISDQAFLSDTQYLGGVWHILIYSLSDWGKYGSLCRVDVGTWNGTTFKAFTLSSVGTIYSLSSVRQTLGQTTAGIVYAGEYLAIQVSNRDTIPHELYTAENGSGSYASGLIGGTIINPSAQSLAASLAASTTLPSAESSGAPPDLVMSVPDGPAVPSINNSPVPAVSTVNKPNTKTPSKNAASKTQFSVIMGILGVGLAMMITFLLYIAEITTNRIAGLNKGCNRLDCARYWSLRCNTTDNCEERDCKRGHRKDLQNSA